MEADLAVELINKTSKTAHVSTLIMDDDSSTIAHIKEKVDHKVNKISDMNHTKKSLGNMLYAMRSTYKELTPKVIKYLQR